MAKRKSSPAKTVVSSIRNRVYAVVVETEDGKKNILCPECGKTPILRSIDYDLTSDKKYVWFTHLCANCNIHVLHFSHTGGGAVDVSKDYDLNGFLKGAPRPPRKERQKKIKKPLPKKVGKREFVLPSFDD